MNKTCNKCGQDKDLDSFCKGKQYKDGRKNICKRCHTDYMIQYYKNNPNKKAAKIRLNTQKRPNWSRHHLSQEEYQKLFDLYSGKCHSCHERDAINIDHDHSCCKGTRSCGKCVRGILCSQCNTALGLMNDNPEMIKKLKQYAELK